MTSKLKIGLLLDDDAIPAWVAHLSSLIAASDIAEIVAVIVYRSGSPSVKRGIPALWAKMPQDPICRFIAACYRLIVDRNPAHADPWAPSSAGTLAHVNRIDLSKGHETASEAVAQSGVDVLFRCGQAAVPKSLLAAAPHGSWSLEQVAADRSADMPAGFFESMTGADLTRSVLTKTASDGQCTVVCESYSSTLKLSASGNVARYYWKALHFFIRMLAASQRGSGSGHRAANAALPTPAVAPIRASWFVWATGKTLARKVVQLVRARLYVENWAMQRARPFSESGPLDPGQFFENPAGGFLADPHFVKNDGRCYLFYEEFDGAAGRGHISVRELDPDTGKFGEPGTALKRPYHLSYPFVFSHGGEHYMIPESAESGRIELYRAQNFPLDWRHETDLLGNVNAADSTLLHHAGKWWLFTNIKEHPGISSWDELFVFFSDDFLKGEWTPHPLNPIVSDSRSARPAGAIIRRGDRLIRPSQESAGIYGSGLNFFEITELTETGYSEQLLRCEHGRSADKAIGMHSYAECGDVAVIDQFVRRARWSSSPRK